MRDVIFSVGARNDSRVLSLMSALRVSAGSRAKDSGLTLGRCGGFALIEERETMSYVWVHPGDDLIGWDIDPWSVLRRNSSAAMVSLRLSRRAMSIPASIGLESE